MPKLKTKSAVKKRFKKTATGEIKGAYAYKRHLLINKPKKMKRKARGTCVLCESVAKIVKKFMH